jgi:hypothetical protein
MGVGFKIWGLGFRDWGARGDVTRDRWEIAEAKTE